MLAGSQVFPRLIHPPRSGHDNSSAPLAMDITSSASDHGGCRLSVEEGSSTSSTVTEAVWPIRDQGPPMGDVPCEVGTRPRSRSRRSPRLTPERRRSSRPLLYFTPALAMKALAVAKNYKLGPVLPPPVGEHSAGALGVPVRNSLPGGTNWALRVVHPCNPHCLHLRLQLLGLGAYFASSSARLSLS